MRQKPADRRESVTLSFKYKNETYHLSYSLAGDRIYETFVHGPKTGTDLDAILATACASISIALQSGASLEDMERAALKLEGGEPADIVSMILSVLVRECTGT